MMDVRRATGKPGQEPAATAGAQADQGPGAETLVAPDLLEPGQPAPEDFPGDIDGNQPISALRRSWLGIEMLILYIGAPLAVYVLVFGYKIALFKILGPVLILFLAILALDRSFSWRDLVLTPLRFRDLASIVGLFLVAAPAIAAYAYVDNPRAYLRFPRHAWDMYVTIMIFYPLISVTAQEVMFRVLYFHRYSPFFGNGEVGRILAVSVNAAFFAFAHVIFNNWPAVAISLVGGFIFAWRYDRTRSFWAIWLEHSLYGNLIFTVGLGRYFFTGVSNLN